MWAGGCSDPLSRAVEWRDLAVVEQVPPESIKMSSDSAHTYLALKAFFFPKAQAGIEEAHPIASI